MALQSKNSPYTDLSVTAQNTFTLGELQFNLKSGWRILGPPYSHIVPIYLPIEVEGRFITENDLRQQNHYPWTPGNGVKIKTCFSVLWV